MVIISLNTGENLSIRDGMVHIYGDNQLEHWRVGLNTQHPHEPHTLQWPHLRSYNDYIITSIN